MKTTDNVELILKSECPWCGTKINTVAYRRGRYVVECFYCSREYRVYKSLIRRCIKEWKIYININSLKERSPDEQKTL